MADPRIGLERRRGVVERARSVEGQMTAVEGFVRCVGVGEATIDVAFPVGFTEMPILEGGGMVDENEVITPTAFPRWSVNVQQWDIWVPEENPMPWYRGATLIIVVDGVGEYFRSLAWYRATGPALTNPIVGGL